MTEQEALSRMIPPGKVRPGKPGGGVIQIHVTRACDLACYNCTQGSQLAGKVEFMTPDLFERAVKSLDGYFGTVGVFGGNPCLSIHFPAYCEILRRHVPKQRCGLWSNNLNGMGKYCRETFNPAVSNLNAHKSREAYLEMLRDWPGSRPFGLDTDSRHSPCFVSMKDLGVGESERWELISGCDINQHWSALIGVFRGELRAWFCEIAGAQAMLHQHEPDYPDTGLDPTKRYHPFKDDPGWSYTEEEPTKENAYKLLWWELGMEAFRLQVRKHCHDCGVPLRGYGELSQSTSGESREQVSQTHLGVYRPKRKGRKVELVVLRDQLGEPLERMTNYLQNSSK